MAPARTWTRDELISLARDNRISLCDMVARDLPIPDWLADVSRGDVKVGGGEAVDSLHPSDRQTIVGLFIEAAASPGEPIVVGARAIYEGAKQVVEITAINLCHQPEVGGIVFVTRVTENYEEIDAGSDVAGDHAATNWMLLTLGESGQIVSAAGNVRELLGYDRDDVIGTAPTAYLPSAAIGDSVRLWVGLNNDPDTTRTSRRPWVRRDGSEIWLEASYVNRRSAPEGEGKILVVVWDITDRREAEAALLYREEQLRRMADDLRDLADEVPSAVFRCDESGRVSFHNARWTDLVAGRGRETVTLHDLLSPAGSRELDDAANALLSEERHERIQLELEGDDGSTTWLLRLRRLYGRPENGDVFTGSVADVSDTVRLRDEASHDRLTGLLNRAAIEREVSAAIAEDPVGTAVVFIDLDNFKAVNDDHGHDAGDTVLAEVASRLRNAVRPGDAVGRWGGDEFVIVCRQTSSEPLEALTARLAAAVHTGPVAFDGGAWDPSVTLGIARPERNEDWLGVLYRADRQMLDRKRRNPNRVARS